MTSQQEWEMTPLGMAADIVMGQSPDSKFYSAEGVGLPFLQGCAEFGNRFPRHKLFCSQNRKLASVGSILFSVRAPVGKLNIADRDYIIGRGLASISGTAVATRYLEHFLQFEEGRLRVASQGSTFEAINSTELAQWPVVHPKNQYEQTKIAEFLSTVDEAIEQTEKSIAKQQRIKSGLTQDLLTRGIDEEGILRSENTWPIQKLCDIADIRVSNVDKKVNTTETPVRLCNYLDVYLNDYVTNEISFMHATATTTEIQRFSLQHGDVVITKDSETPDDIGVPAVVSDEIEHLVCGYHLCLIRPNTSDLNSVYLAKQLGSPKIAQYFAIHANGSTRFGLPIESIENLTLPFPSRSEQMMIAEILSTADQCINQTGMLLAELRLIKRGLMQDLLTGKVSAKPLLTEAEISV